MTDPRYDWLLTSDPGTLDALFRRFVSDPASVDPGLRHFFEGFQLGCVEGGAGVAGEAGFDPAGVEHERKEFQVLALIHEYRTRGHLFTPTNPVRTRRCYTPDLNKTRFGLDEADLDHVFHAGREVGLGPATLRDILSLMEETYCTAIGAEYMFVRVPERVRWLRERMESTRNRPAFTIDRKRAILDSLSRAVVFENFLHAKFPGQKRFSVSGGESLIPALEALVSHGAQVGVREIVASMAHRGRINVLANVFGKPWRDLFEEFEGCSWEDEIYAGDVKYHLGWHGSVSPEPGREIILNLVPNPSHLEAGGTVAQGFARARIEHFHGGDASRALPVIVHGDAALSAQGVVYELVQMAGLEAHRTGGTLHLAVNNQIGFTTPYLEGRTSTYCTDVAKVTLSPVFHVNADDVEAVVLAVEMALEYRQAFQSDVFIDLLGYRRYGHNESDEPRFTQPKLYRAIAEHPDPMTLYRRKLAAEGIVTEHESLALERGLTERLAAELKAAREESAPHCHYMNFCDRRRRPSDLDLVSSPPTGVPEENLSAAARAAFHIPESVAAFGKIRKIYDGHLENFFNRKRVDWAMAELLALGTLALDGVPVRLCGQDSERGTFSHRHAVVTDEVTEAKHAPLQHLAPGQAPVSVYNSLLSEYAALGFEYGYARGCPNGLTLWEAQFGDFANGAQIVVDQYLAAAEAKWNELNGVVLLLPHGYEGQGPEHSSARIERFLQLCTGGNLVVAQPSTPASYFHLLRRHARWPVRPPLVVFTPKSLLRRPECADTPADLAGGVFHPLLDDGEADPAAIRQVLLCSGRIYYDLAARRRERGALDTALVRLEQLHPLTPALGDLPGRYPAAVRWAWVQDEPENMGPALFLRLKLPGLAPAFAGIEVVARRESGAPATGFHDIHDREQRQILEKAFR
ncbi:MAG: 2-oxoglutarate dehydrogenase E1 component [Acidobacteria bacterium]|nr:2-oxoglutarate dehydrogenase E1 component [Acidobacteriota bacterium]